MKNLLLAICFTFCFVSTPSLAQDDSREADREAMLVVLSGIEQALNDRDLTSAHAGDVVVRVGRCTGQLLGGHHVDEAVNVVQAMDDLEAT